MSVRNLFIISIAICGILLSGCASNVKVAKQLSTQASLPPGEGILVARVINTTSYRLPINSMYIDPKEVNTSKEVKTVLAYAEDMPIGDSTLFAVSLEPGEYSLSVIRSLIFRGEAYYSRGTATDPEFGVFKVEAGKVTDLGTIVYYAKPSDDVYKDTLIRVPESAQGQVLKKYFPQFATGVSNFEEILTWESDERDEQRFGMYASAAQNPMSFSDEIRAPDGSLYFLSKLGVILRYSPEDGFETLAIDSDLEVNAFAQNDAGDRVAGGFEGALFFQAVDGDWEAVSVPEKATIHYLTFYQENQFDVVYSVTDKLHVVRFNKEDLTTSSELNTYSYAKGWENVSNFIQPKTKPPKPHNIKSVWVAQNGVKKVLKVNNYRVGRWDPFDASDTESYSFSPDNWEMAIAPSSLEVDAVITAGSVEIGIKSPGFWSWTGKPSYFSRENEQSPWREMNAHITVCKKDQVMQSNGVCLSDGKGVKPKKESFSFKSRPWFWDANNGLAIVNFSDFNAWTGQRSSETKILKTADGGVSWETTELTLPKEYCSNIIGEIKERILLSCNGATSDFFESTDLAESWEHIRQQQDF